MRFTYELKVSSERMGYQSSVDKDKIRISDSNSGIFQFLIYYYLYLALVKIIYKHGCWFGKYFSFKCSY